MADILEATGDYKVLRRLKAREQFEWSRPTNPFGFASLSNSKQTG